MSAAKHTPTDMALTLSETRACVSCAVEGFHYHVWLDVDTLKPEEAAVLYKNPPFDAPQVEGNRRGRTMHLSLSRGIGARLVPLMLAAIPDLLPEARQKLADEIARRKEQTKAVWKEHYAKAAALELLEASLSTVERLADLPRFLRAENNPTLAEIVEEELAQHRAAIAKATGSTS